MTLESRTDRARPDWLIIVSLAIPSITLGALLFAMGVFFKPLEAEFGWTRTVTSLGYTAFLTCYGISNVFMGRVLDRYGYRFVMFLAVFLTGGAIISLGLIQNPGQFRALMVLTGLGMGGCFVAPTTMVQRWFSEKRGYLLGIITSGFGLGALVFAPLLDHFISSYGWRRSHLILGLYIVVSLAVSTVVLSRRVGRTGAKQGISTGNGKMPITSPQWTTHQILRARPYILIFVAGCVGVIGYTMLQVHLVPYATDVGLSATSAAAALGIMGGIIIPVRLSIGFLQQKFGWHRLYMLGYIGRVAAVVVILRLSSIEGLYGYAVVFGAANALSAPVLSGLLGDYFGLTSLGTVMGFSMGGSLIVGGLVGPLIGGASYDATQSYLVALMVVLGLLVVATILAAMARRPSPAQVTQIQDRAT